MAQEKINEQLAEVLQGNTTAGKAVLSVLEARFLQNFIHPDFLGMYSAKPSPLTVQGGSFIFRQVHRPVPQTFNASGTPTIYNPTLDTVRIFADSSQTLPLELTLTDLAGLVTEKESLYDVQGATVGNFIKNASYATQLHLNAEITKVFKDKCTNAEKKSGVAEKDANLFTLPETATTYRSNPTTAINYALWQFLADKVGILEEKITMKAIGLSRANIHIFLDNRLYKNLTTPNGIVGVQAIAEATVSNIPMGQTIAGAPLHKHILLNQKFTKVESGATVSDGRIHKTDMYDFSSTSANGESGQTGGIAALIFAEDSFALPMNFNNWLPTKSPTTGFPRLIGHYQYGKDLLRPDFCYVIRYKS